MSRPIRKLELDVMMASEIAKAFDYVGQYQLPAIVVHPQLVGQAAFMRAVRRSPVKIFTTIDWPKGEQFSTAKMSGLPVTALEADGFEIMLSAKKTANQAKQEVHGLVRFIRDYISPHVEIRFVIGALERELPELLASCKAQDGLPGNYMIRTDSHTRGQINKFSPKAHFELLEQISQITKAPIKVSGNVDTGKLVRHPKAERLAVSLVQIEKIIRDLDKPEPEKVEKDG